MSTILAFDNIQIKHSFYCRENCMKSICSSLREYTTNVSNFEKIPVVFYNGSNYDCHFIIKDKDLTKEFKGQFECLGENTEKIR